MEKTFFFPESNSTFAPTVDAIYWFILLLSGFFFFVIVGLMIYFMIKYRRVEGQEPEVSPSHNTPLEVTWSIVPGFLVLAIFAWGFIGYVDMRSPPAEAYEINVNASMWAWNFQYKTGAVDGKLHVPVGTPVKLVMQSKDVLHSLFIPAFRVKQDVVPGRYSGLWFEAIEPGEFDLFCTEYCGQKHSDMITKVVVHPTDPADLKDGEQTFDEWLEIASDPTKDSNGNPIPPAEAGKKVIGMFGCMQCHSVTGEKKVGPTFKGSFGTQITLQGGGTVPMDENYIRESILEPQAKIHQGYDPKMPSFKGQMKDEWIDAVIAYIQSLKE